MRFILVGTLNALITVLIVWLMMDKLGCNYICYQYHRLCDCADNNFFWSKYWIFSSAPVSFAVRFPFF